MSRESKRQRKEQAKARRTEERLRRERRRRVARFVLVSLPVLLLAYAGYWAYGRITEPVTWQELPSLGRAHISTPTTPHIPYNSDPPTSGPHTPYLARWGIHNQPVPKEVQVHNLEHGGVIIQYNCECPALVKKLTGIARRYEGKPLILAPYPGMDQKIALTAWTRIDKFNEFDEERYFPISSACARMCPSIAFFRSCLVVLAGRFSVVSSA